MATMERKISEPDVLNEAAIKVALIDHVINDVEEGGFITRELPYSFNRRRADLVIIGQHFTAFEIKSDIDNLGKLNEQIHAYKKSFHSLYVVTTEKHLGIIKKMTPRNVGVYLFTSVGIQKIRNATIRKRLDKKRLLSLIDRSAIEQALINKQIKSSQLKRMTVEGLYNLAARILNQTKIEVLVQTELRLKYLGGYALFLSERGRATVTDDLLLLGKEREIS